MTAAIQEQITRISGNVNNALNAIADYGVAVTDEDNSGDLERLIKQIANPLPIGRGGTGAQDALTARTNLMIKIGTEDPAGEDEPGTIYIKFA